MRLADTEAQALALPDKALVEALIKASREAVENYTGRQLCPATYELRGEMLPETVEIPKLPFVQITSVKYHTGTEEKTLDNTGYTVIEGATFPLVLIKVPEDAAQVWNGVKIQFTTGYTVVPESLKVAMKLFIGHFYENREEVTVGAMNPKNPVASEYLMNPYRVYR